MIGVLHEAQRTVRTVTEVCRNTAGPWLMEWVKVAQAALPPPGSRLCSFIHRERKSSVPPGASALPCEPNATWAVSTVCCSDSRAAATRQNSDRLSTRPGWCVYEFVCICACIRKRETILEKADCRQVQLENLH